MNLRTVSYWLGFLIVVHLGMTWFHASYGGDDASQGRCLREQHYVERGLQGNQPVFEELYGLNVNECESAGAFFIHASSGQVSEPVQSQ